MPCYSIDGLVPVVDPSAFVHPSADLIGDVWVGRVSPTAVMEPPMFGVMEPATGG